MTRRFVQVSVLLMAGMNLDAYATTRDDLDFSRQILNDDFLAVPVADTNYAFVWARKVKASYEFRSTGAGSQFQTLAVTFRPAFSLDTRDQVLARAGLQDRGPLEAFTYFQKNEISCQFSPEVLAFFAENQQPAPRVTATVGGYPNLCSLSVRVPTSWKEDLTNLLQNNSGLAFQARPVLCRKESPRMPVRDLLQALETRNIGVTLPSGEWQAPYLNFVYESVSLAQNPTSIFGKNGGRQLWEKFFEAFTVDTTQKLVTLPSEAVRSKLFVCQEQPWEVTYVGAEASAP